MHYRLEAIILIYLNLFYARKQTSFSRDFEVKDPDGHVISFGQGITE